jgi:hypothetical protein
MPKYASRAGLRGQSYIRYKKVAARKKQSEIKEDACRWEEITSSTMKGMNRQNKVAEKTCQKTYHVAASDEKVEWW